MAIGENIRKIRKEKKLTQKELGKLCGMSEAQIGQYENGLRNPKMETLKKIAKALKVSSFDLIDGYKIPVYQVKHINIEFCQLPCF